MAGNPLIASPKVRSDDSRYLPRALKLLHPRFLPKLLIPTHDSTYDMAVERVKQVASHLGFGSAKGRDALLRKSPDDVVITMAIRSPLCKAKKGGFKDTK